MIHLSSQILSIVKEFFFWQSRELEFCEDKWIQQVLTLKIERRQASFWEDCVMVSWNKIPNEAIRQEHPLSPTPNSPACWVSLILIEVFDFVKAL